MFVCFATKKINPRVQLILNDIYLTKLFRFLFHLYNFEQEKRPLRRISLRLKLRICNIYSIFNNFIVRFDNKL